GFHLQSKVADLIVNGAWAWPQSWLHKASDIGNILVPALDGLKSDMRQWRDLNGNLSSFTVAKAWEAIRLHGNQVDWFQIVWFSHNIPRHAFHLWLVMRNGLKTHDRMSKGMEPMGNKRTARCIIGKLIVAATAYFIWFERNNRTFKNVRRSPEEIRDMIMVNVRLKLLSLRFKNTDSVKQLLGRWKMPKNFRIYG
ncbi:retrotransposon protein, putative, ty1-copia subclass, partial [Tanacetum coccineum]